jgi:hypothetical protein
MPSRKTTVHPQTTLFSTEPAHGMPNLFHTQQAEFLVPFFRTTENRIGLTKTMNYGVLDWKFAPPGTRGCVQRGDAS